MAQISQNTERATHNKGRLQKRAMILVNCVPFQNGGFMLLVVTVLMC